MLKRSGSTLLELTVSLALGALVLLLVMALGTRQQRLYRAIGERLASEEQLDQGAAILPLELRGLSTPLGDVLPGGATDTTLEFRATLVSAIVCAATSTEVVLTPESTEPPYLGSYLATPEPGDTAWILVVSDSVERWRTFTVRSERAVGGDADYSDGCTEPWNRLLPTGSRGISIGLSANALAVGVVPGSPVRITRHARYSFYRAGDGHWYLGYREWNASSGEFDQVQPVSGPYASPRTGPPPFRYFDRTGNELPPELAHTTALGWIEAELIPERAGVSASRTVTSAGTAGSALVVVSPRNRR